MKYIKYAGKKSDITNSYVPHTLLYQIFTSFHIALELACLQNKILQIEKGPLTPPHSSLYYLPKNKSQS